MVGQLVGDRLVVAGEALRRVGPSATELTGVGRNGGGIELEHRQLEVRLPHEDALRRRPRRELVVAGVKGQRG